MKIISKSQTVPFKRTLRSIPNCGIDLALRALRRDAKSQGRLNGTVYDLLSQ